MAEAAVTSFFKSEETGQPGQEDGPANGNEALLIRLKKLFQLDVDASRDWRKAAKEDFDFVAGEQWDEKDKARLATQLRPIITFNRVLPVVNAVSGQEIQNRQEVRFVPREEGDAAANEMLTEAGRWFRDQGNADDEDTEAFLNTAICGMGWTDNTLDYEEEEYGCPKIEAVNPLEMYWDCNARKRNLTDAERVWRVRRMSLARAKDLFPGKSVFQLDAKWAQADIENKAPSDNRASIMYMDTSRDDADSDDDTVVTVIHCEYKVREFVYTVADPSTGTRIDLTESEHKKLKARAKEIGIPVYSTRRTRTQVKQAFIGGEVLQYGDGLCGSHFRYQCVTGYSDHVRGQFFGVVRSMKDPQRWSNKWLSQTLDLMNTQVKGGVILEKGAVENMTDFEDSWANASKPTVVANGALTGPNGPKIKEKPVAQFPASFFNMMEFAISATRDVTGISVEMLGLREADQPASLEFQRRQAGLTILAPLFQNLKRYRHDQGKVMLYLIQNYLTDGRLVRILGDNPRTAQYLPLLKQADLKYDIIVDDMPTAPNQKEMVWALVGDRIWDLPPPIQMALLKYSPLPGKTIEEIQKAGQSMSESPQAKLQQQMMQLEAALNEATAMLKQAQTQKTMAETEQIKQQTAMGGEGADPANMVKAQGELAIKSQESQQKMAISQMEAQTKLAKTQMDAQLDREKAGQDMQLRAFETQSNVEMQRQNQAFTQQTEGIRLMGEERRAERGFAGDERRAEQDQAMQRQNQSFQQDQARGQQQFDQGLAKQRQATDTKLAQQKAKQQAAKPKPSGGR